MSRKRSCKGGPEGASVLATCIVSSFPKAAIRWIALSVDQMRAVVKAEFPLDLARLFEQRRGNEGGKYTAYKYTA
jgi:hypothetical protein